MRFSEFPPPATTEDWIECLWQFDVEGAERVQHLIVPDGAVSLTVISLNSGDRYAGLTGPSPVAHRAQLIPGATYAGVRLRPGVAGSILRADVRTFRDVMGPVDPPPPALTRLRAAAHAPDRPLLDVVSDAARWLAADSDPRDEPVCALADRIINADGALALGLSEETDSVSERHLRRRFKRQCGLTPKELARLRRVRAACVALVVDGMSLAEAAISAGFADQAHMSREFSRVFGGSAGTVDHYLEQIQHEHLVL